MNIRTLLAAVVTLCLLSGCSTGKKTTLPYFADVQEVMDGSLQTLPYISTIEPGSELQITVTSTVPGATSAYNLPEVNPATTSSLTTSTSPRTLTYIVDTKGDIDFPVLGKIHVAGLNVEQVQQLLVDRISASVRDPQVTVRMANFTVSVNGEVKQPQVVNVNGTRITVLEALAQAGDITEYGERSNVMIIREENGARTYHRLDLNKIESLNSPYYYLRPNDVVYVSPNKVRQENSKYNQNNGYKLSVISTIVSGASVIASLVIALTVK